MYNINDSLQYMARMLDKMKQEVHEIQHLSVSAEDKLKLDNTAKELTEIAFKIHLLAENWSQKYQAPLPEVDLKAMANNDLIQKLRHFKGKGE